MGVSRKSTWEKKGAVTALVSENQGLVDAFLEMSNLSFSFGEKFKGAAYKKSAAALAQVSKVIEEGDGKRFAKGKDKLAGVGKATGDKIEEYVTTGKMQKLEDL